MEESDEMHPEEDIILPEKNIKRKLKSPAQIEALENFYNEHTYPTEELKAQFAEDNGLSLKQVSGWFCHRRLKDKRKQKACANGRQDLSSGVIQDHGSGLKQDSCSSNKQGNYRNFDYREVESRRFDGTDYIAPDPTCRNRSEGLRTRHFGPVGDTSSGTSSTSHEKLLPQSETPYDTESSRYPVRSNEYMLMSRSVENKGKMVASGYLRLQDEVANAAIIAVKRQLGRYFCEDGPSLGIEFQPLPPGAFDLQEPYQFLDPIQQTSHGISKSRKERHIDMPRRYPRHHLEMSPPTMNPKAARIIHTKSKSVRQDCAGYPSTGKSYFSSYSEQAPGEYPNKIMDESSEDDTSMIKSNKKFWRSTKSKVDGIRSHSTTNNRSRAFAGKFVSGESSLPPLHKYDIPRPCKSQKRDALEAKPLNLINQHREVFDAKDRVVKGGNLHKDKRMSKECVNPLKEKKNHKNDVKVGKRFRGEVVLPRDYALVTAQPEDLLPQRNQIKERVGGNQTSFHEDAAATSSSTS